MSQTRSEARQARRAARARRRTLRGGPWAGALVLIALGVMLLIEDFTAFALNQWWALLFLIPAAGGWITAWNAYRAGQPRQAMTAFVAGLVCLGLALVFVFEVDLPWTSIWSLLLIAAGASLLLRRPASA